MTRHAETKSGKTAMVGLVASVMIAFLYLVYRIISGRGD